MNTDSFKQRQLLFQTGGNQSNNQPKVRQSLPILNKDIFQPKSKTSNTNINNKNNNQETNNTTQKKLNMSTNPILKIANKMESKMKIINDDQKKRKSVQVDTMAIDLNTSKDSISKNEPKKILNQQKSKNDIKKIEKKEEKQEIKKEEKKEEKKELKKEIKKEEIKKEDKKENKKENKISKIEVIKNKAKEIFNKTGEQKNDSSSSKKDDKIEVKKDNKINEITKKFEKEIKKEDKKIDIKADTTKDNKDNSKKNQNIITDVKADNKNEIKHSVTKKEVFKDKTNIIIKKNISSNLFKTKDSKGSKINNIQERESVSDKNKFENLYDNLYNNNDEDIFEKKRPKKTLSDLEIDNFKDFNEEDYSERKYDKSNIDLGKIFFKYRYLKNKYTQINETIKRLSNVGLEHNLNINNIINDKRISSVNSAGLTFNNNLNNINDKRNTINIIDNKFKLSNNIHLSFFIQNPSAQCLNSIDKDSELRHNHSQFLQFTEKSILCFNLKKYEESYLYLYSNNIIKNIEEFGEFLLVVNGFDKFIIGDFLSNTHSPNDKKEVLKAFINGVKMDYNETSFLECFRFFMKRLYLPKDANLILEIMNTFSETYFETNKNYNEFVHTYKNPNNIYLLISTLLAVNTMFTRKDIKNINIIKKEEFVSMNKDIPETVVMSLYEALEKNPLSIDSENYNENIYKRMSTLVKEKISSSKSNNDPLFLQSKTFNSNIQVELNKLDDKSNFTINEEDSDEEYDSNFQIDTTSPENKTNSNTGGGYRPITRSSFSLTKNLYSFTKQDQDILQKIQKFYKLVGNELLHEREFLVYDNFTKLIWGKSVDSNKVKGNLHCLMITDIIDVFNGIEHSDNIKKYVKSNPKELKEKNNYITIISNKRKINLKSDSLQTALLWYKALKSLVLKTKNENFKKNSKALNEMNTQFKLQLEELWKDFILPKWNIYGNYILTKLKRTYETQDKKELNNPKNIETIIKDTENDKILDYNDFFQFFYLGLPSFCRGTIWRLLIGNSCSITETLYENFSANVEPENFNTFDIQYHEDINTIFNREYNLNQMIADIIKTKDFFLADLIKLKIDQEQIMTESYNVLRIFFLMRNDLVYKKSIVPLIFVFLMVDENEYNAFCNIYNLICNTDIIKFYIGDEDYIKKNVDLFSTLVKKHLPKIHEHFNNLEIAHELYFIPWICEIFSSSMSYKLLLRVLDLFLINGEYILFQIGLSILAIQEDDLLDLAISEIFKLLKKLSSKYKEDIFLEKMKSFYSVKEDYNRWKNENELGGQKLQLFQAIFDDDK